MKRLFSGIALSVLGSLAFSGNANAACGDSGGGDNDPFGTTMNLSAQGLFSQACDEYVLNPSDILYKSDSVSLSEVLPLDGSVTNAALSAVFSVDGFGFATSSETNYTGAIPAVITLSAGEVQDTVILKAPSNVTSYSGSVEVCGEFQTQAPVFTVVDTNGLLATIGGSNADVNISFGSAGSDFTITPIGANGIFPVGLVEFTPTSTGEQCVTGSFTVDNIETELVDGVDVPLDVEFELTLGGGGGVASEVNPLGGGNVQGDFSGSITFKTLSSGVSCTALSGTNSACGELGVVTPITINPQKCPNGCETSVGNPINFSLGFKHETVTDYSSGSLSFTRQYRSDASWYTGHAGANWRHNYDLSVLSDGTNATVTTAQGLVYTFENTGSGWSVITDDSNFTATLEDTAGGFTFTDTNDARYYFDSIGKVTRIEYRAGDSLNLAYDGSNRLISVTDEQGKTLVFTYSGLESRVSTMTTEDGIYSYSYDANGNLETVTKPDTKVITYHYEDTNFINAMTGITDEKNVRYSTYSYDTQGRAVSSEHANGVNNFTIAYNADDSVTTTNPLGKQTTFYFETIKGVRRIVNVDGHASANCAAANKAYTYDANGWIASKTDWNGNVTSYIRDSRGLVTSMSEADGSTESRTTTYTYDPVYRLPDVITEVGLTTNYDYDADGRVISETLTDTATGETRTTSYSYHPNTVDGFGNTVLGNLASIDGARTDVTDVTTFEYDVQNRLIKTTNALGHTTETLSFDASDRPLEMQDANGVITKHVYDAQGRLTSVTDAHGSALAAETRYILDDKGRTQKIIAPNGSQLRYVYDDADRLIKVFNSDSRIVYTLDNAGNQKTIVYRDDAGVLRYKHRTVFDELSRPIRDINDNNEKTKYTYDVNSNMLKVIDGNLNVNRFVYDGLDRQIRSFDADNGKTVNTYNELDQLTAVKDPRENKTRYVYNAFGDVKKEISPDRGTIIYTVDEAGNTTRMKDARGVVTNYTYDVLNRLTKTAYPSDTTQNVILTYDMDAGCGVYVGRLCRVKDAGGITRYVYDELGRLTQVKEIRGAITFITQYGYDLSGNITSITYPSGRTIVYAYNGNNEVISVDEGSTNFASNIIYLPFGDIESLSFGNGVNLTNTYNTSYQLTNRQIGAFINDSYTYDAAGNITAKSATSYTLDNLYRITDESGAVGLFNYTYDPIGNRLTEDKNGSFSTYTYPSTSSILTDINTTPIVTDAAGNITQDASRSYVIDVAGRIASVSDGVTTLGSYTYDGNNLRTQKVTAIENTHYVYGAGGMLYGEYDALGNVVREYVYLNGEPLVQVDSGTPETISYLHTDHLGTPRVASDGTGAEVWRWDSDAFGNGTPTGAQTVNLRFAGQYYDSESNLHYNWNRYYDPATGRYISSDPIGLEGGLNTFGYVSANPIIYTDPEGLAAQACLIYLPCAKAVVDIVATGVSVGIGVIGTKAAGEAAGEAIAESVADSSNEGSNSEAVKRAERNRYHQICDTPPPPSGDLCEDAKADVDWHQACIDARMEFSEKWYDGVLDEGHATQIEEKTKALNKARNRIRAHCEPEECEGYL